MYEWLHDYLVPTSKAKINIIWIIFLTPLAFRCPCIQKKKIIFKHLFYSLKLHFFRILAYCEMACNNSINSRDFIFFQKLIGHLLLLVLVILTSLRGCVRSFTLLDPITGRELQFRLLSPRFWRLYKTTTTLIKISSKMWRKMHKMTQKQLPQQNKIEIRNRNFEKWSRYFAYVFFSEKKFRWC